MTGKERNRDMSQDTMCKFCHFCPCASGWCRLHQPDASCVPFLISAYNGLRAVKQGKGWADKAEERRDSF